MATWIFQGNPDDYDIDGYLASRPTNVTWLVTRYGSEIAIGDRVFFWRNKGTATKAVPGIIAEGIVTAGVQQRPEDPEGVKFWRVKDGRASELRPRALMRLIKVATRKSMITRDWCSEDPVLRDLPNLKMQNATNYRVEASQAARIAALWSRTGRDWTRDESIAGLWAYVKTVGGAVSSLPGSPVSRVALLTGRSVSAAYAKVMNFRSLDPRTPAKGMTAASDTDREVWAGFFDGTLDEAAVQREFERVWGETDGLGGHVTAEAAATRDTIQAEVRALEKSDLKDLLARYFAQRNEMSEEKNGKKYGRGAPSVRTVSSRVFERDPLVIAIALKRADHQCEIPECRRESFETPEGWSYAEVHHIEPLGEGGPDVIENVACVCASHHREAHFGVQRGELKEMLQRLRIET